MDHIAILRKASKKKNDNILGDILAGLKTIESRWYVSKITPWGKVTVGDTVYFKESGCPVSAKASVSKVLQFDKLTPECLEQIAISYSKKISPHLSQADFLHWAINQPTKKYCILVFIKDAARIAPFEINKTGFGISSAWLTVDTIKTIVKP